MFCSEVLCLRCVLARIPQCDSTESTHLCCRSIINLVDMPATGRVPKRQRVDGGSHYSGGYMQQVAARDLENERSGDVSAPSTAPQSGNRGASSTAPPYESKLARHLITLVMWGFISECAAHRLADLARQDGAKGVGLGSIASVGSRGVHKQNSFRGCCRS